MARRRELPGWLDAVHPRFRTPHRAEVVTAVVVAGIVSVADLRDAIGFSSFAVLTYYALANASALRLAPEERRWPRGLATLPLVSVTGGLGLLVVGSLVWFATRTRRIGPVGRAA